MNPILLQLGRETELCYEEAHRLAVLNGWTAQRYSQALVSLTGPGSIEDLGRVLDESGGIIRAIEPVPVPEEDVALVAKSEALRPTGPWALSALSSDLRSQRESVREAVRQRIQDDPEAQGREERAAPGEYEVVPARVWEKRLVERGLEICLFRTPEGAVGVGKTVWVYSPEDFASRDLEKPFRPRKRGLLPPKLARQMINLARTPQARSLLDPFCGSGVVLIEGVLLGFDVMGSDMREEAIDQTRENLKWLFTSGPPEYPARLKELRRADARLISTVFYPLSIDMVVGEGDLGPPVRGKLPRKLAAETSQKLEPLYVRAFAEIRTLLSAGGRVCLATPFWQPNDGDPIHMNLVRKLGLMGYRPGLSTGDLKPVLYRRADQRVGRAIYVLETQG